MADGVLAGIDGGASKTRAVIVGTDGATLGTATVRSSSAYHREAEEAAAVVLAAIREALAQTRLAEPIAALGAGLAGADDPATHERLVRALEASGVAPVVLVDHDAAAALAGGTALEPGIVVIAGTGSVAFGVDATGRRARADGWGPLLGDDGSGYAIGRAVLRAAMRAFDGRGPATALADAVQQRFELSSLARLKIAVRGLAIDEVAAIAPLAAVAAQAGDMIASDILRRAGEGLASTVAAVARALGWHHDPFPLITVGGVFQAGALVTMPLLETLGHRGCRPEWRSARFAPEIGAALLAARAAGLDTARLTDALSQSTPRGSR